MTLQDIKRLSIRDYLSRRGIQPARENDRCGFYLSPLRAEHTPSFKVDYVLNLWHDFVTLKDQNLGFARISNYIKNRDPELHRTVWEFLAQSKALYNRFF